MFSFPVRLDPFQSRSTWKSPVLELLLLQCFRLWSPNARLLETELCLLQTNQLLLHPCTDRKQLVFLTSFLYQPQVVAVPLIGEQRPETEEEDDASALQRLPLFPSSHSPVCAGFSVHHLLVRRRQCRAVLAQVDGHLRLQGGHQQRHNSDLERSSRV